VADVNKILELVEQGVLTPDEADAILATLAGDRLSASATGLPMPPEPAAAPQPPSEPAPGARHIRIQISEHGRQVVNLRVPINIASFAADFVPGLPDAEAERIRQAIRSGVRGPLVDIGTDDGERVVIVSE
jgi:hypothetical protein